MNTSLHPFVYFCNFLVYLKTIPSNSYFPTLGVYCSRIWNRRSLIREHEIFADKSKWKHWHWKVRYRLSSNSINTFSLDFLHNLRKKTFSTIMILLVSEIELSRLEILIIYHLILCNYTYFGCFSLFCLCLPAMSWQVSCHRNLQHIELRLGWGDKHYIKILPTVWNSKNKSKVLFWTIGIHNYYYRFNFIR